MAKAKIKEGDDHWTGQIETGAFVFVFVASVETARFLYAGNRLVDEGVAVCA